jgi:hypothetical protein
LDTFIVNTSQTVSTSESSIVLTEKEIGVLKSWSAESGWFDALRHCHRQASSEGAFAVQLHTWFDGFRTLKFVHYMRQHLYASLPAYDLLKEHGKVQQEFDDAVLAKFEKRLYDSAAHVSD